MSIENYIRNLAIADFDLGEDTENRRRTRRGAPQTDLPADLKAAVDAGSLISFVDGVEPQEREDILFSVQYAQRAASAAFDRFAESRSWYAKYIEVLEILGWAGEQFAFAEYRQDEGELQMDKAALAIITAVATQNQLAVITQSIKALEALADDDGTINLFEYQSSTEGSGNFQIGAVQRGASGTLSMALGAFYFRAAERKRRFLFFRWRQKSANFWTGAQKMTFNVALYDRVREAVSERLGQRALDYIAALPLV